MSGTDTSETEKLRRLLRREKKRLEESIEGFSRRGLERPLGEAIMEFSTYDNHPADVGTETFEREKDYGLREDQMTTLDLVESALRRLESGRYGRCDRCGRLIASERLEAVPWTLNCRSCEEALEKEKARDGGRPAEEEARPAFSSFTDDDPDDPVGFDGEDAWQAVARYGTSNTPGDFPGATGYDETYINAEEDIGVVEEVERIADTDFAPGQDGAERTLSYRKGHVVSNGGGRGKEKREGHRKARRKPR